MTHTPGPWTQQTFGIYAGKELVAHTGGTLGAGPKTQEQEANARLIAAAPDLLAACKIVLKDQTGHGEGSLWGETVKTLNAAIAKAERQP